MTNRFLKVFLNRRIFICLFTGFSSGFPYYVFQSLIFTWLAKEDVSLRDIGLITIMMLPYTWKFLWAPFLDEFGLPFLGLRRGWMLVSQIFILLTVIALPWFSPKDSLDSVVYLCLLLIFFSATQDIVIDAYRRELLREEELGLGNQIHVQAWRAAFFIPGGLGIILGDYLPWKAVFFIVACFMFISIAMTLLIEELSIRRAEKVSLNKAIVDPFKEFIHRNGMGNALMILAFMFFYKLGDNMATTLATPFYIGIGYSLTEIGLVAKNAVFWGALIGGMLGGIWMIKLGINRSLWVFGIFQITSIPGFHVLASIEHNLLMLGVVVAYEYLGVGLGAAALLAYIMKSTSPRFAATQIALLSSFIQVPRILAGAITGYLVEGVGEDSSPAIETIFKILQIPENGMGWPNFFIFCTVIAVPGMLMLFKIAPWNTEDTSVLRDGMKPREGKI